MSRYTEAVKRMWASWVCNREKNSNTPPFALLDSTQPTQSACLFKYRQEDHFLVGTWQEELQQHPNLHFSCSHTATLISTVSVSLLTKATQSFPKTLLSSLFQIFLHLSTSVLLLRKWYNRVRRLHQTSWGRVMATIHLQCCYKEILSRLSKDLPEKIKCMCLCALSQSLQLD